MYVSLYVIFMQVFCFRVRALFAWIKMERIQSIGRFGLCIYYHIRVAYRWPFFAVVQRFELAVYSVFCHFCFSERYI